jgi:hypothetical protein
MEDHVSLLAAPFEFDGLACVLMTYMLFHLDFDMGDSLVC